MGKGDYRRYDHDARQNLYKTLFMFISDLFASEKEEEKEEG